MKQVIFVGGIADGKKFGGELTKNRFLLTELEKHFSTVYKVDIHKARKYPSKIIRLLFYAFIFPTTPIVYSTSYRNIKWLDNILFYLMPNRKKILWAIGGNLHTRIEEGGYSIRMFKKFKKILVEGDMIKQGLNKLGLYNVEVCPNFKTFSYVPNIESKSNMDIVKFKFVFFSRIIPEKGVNDIFKAAEILNGKGYSTFYEIDFFGPVNDMYKDEFSYSIENNQNISYKGFLDFSNVKSYDLLSTYHLTLFPTYWHGEGFPGVIVDSFIAGVPVAASSWGLNSEIIKQNINGFIVPPKNPEQLASLLERIITHDIDIRPMFKSAQKDCFNYNTPNIITEKFVQQLFL